MEEDYFSVEAILAENQVGRILDEQGTDLTVVSRKFSVHLSRISPTSVI